MRTVTVDTLKQDRERGWAKIIDEKNKRLATIVWDENQEQSLDASFRIILKDSNGKDVDAVFNKNDFQKHIRWA